MALKKIMMTAAAVLATQAFASSRVEQALTLSSETAAARKADKAKAPKARVFDSLDSSRTQKTELPTNARHEATGGVFI